MLSSFQERIARLFLAMPEALHFALAGGAALVFRREVQRETRDLDFFTPVAEEIRAVADRFEERLRDEGLAFRVISSSPTFRRLVVIAADGQEVLVDIAYDYRLREPEASPIGPLLTIEDLAADKLLALFGRAEARDFVDVFALARKCGIAEMLTWAKQKDPGFDPYVLAAMIGQIARHPRPEFQVDDSTYASLQDFFRRLRISLMEEVLGPE